MVIFITVKISQNITEYLAIIHGLHLENHGSRHYMKIRAFREF